MRAKTFLKPPQFSIRAVLVITALVALGMLSWRERLRYLHEHISVSVVDQGTGVRLPHFQYQTSVITSETGQFESWSDWQRHNGPSLLTIKVPKYCRFEIRARALDVGGGYDENKISTLVLPQAFGHTTTLRLSEGKSLESYLVDGVTLEPIRGAIILPSSVESFDELPDTPGCFQSPFFDVEFATASNSDGRFIVRNLSEGFAIVAPKYQRQFSRFKDASADDLSNWQMNGIKLEPAVRVIGQITCESSGAPIRDCTVALNRGWLSENDSDECESIQLAAPSELDRRTMTDESGHFELFIDGRLEDSTIRLSRKGWVDKFVELVDQEMNIELTPWPQGLAGSVVDEFGSPIQEFEITTNSNWPSGETYVIKSETGKFSIRTRDRPYQYRVRAKGKGDFSKDLGESLNEFGADESEPTNELVTLTDGSAVSGTMVGHETQQSNVCLTLCRLADQPEYTGWFLPIEETHHTAHPHADGSFRFDHVSNGTYEMVTSMFGHVVNTRPVVVKSQDVVVGPIALPQTGRVHGRVQSENGADASFHRMYITDHQGTPVRWFHTDHRGEFELENIPAGWVGIGPKPARMSFLYCGMASWSIHDSIVVDAGQTNELSFEDFLIFELHGLPHLDENWGNLVVSKRSAPSANTYFRTHDIQGENTKMIQVLSHCKAEQGDAFSLEMSNGHCRQDLPMVYQANRRKLPDSILFRTRKLRLHFADTSLRLQPIEPEPHFKNLDSDDPFADPVGIELSVLDSERYVGKTTIFLLKQQRLMSSVSMIGLHENVRFQVDGHEPDEAWIHNTHSGWAHIEKLRMFDGKLGSNEVQFMKGVELRGKLNLAGLLMMPSCIRLVDPRGATFIAETSQVFVFEFKNLWPGKWLLQAIGNDHSLGERVLAERLVDLEGTDCQTFDFGGG